jgi:hypothetical protein
MDQRLKEFIELFNRKEFFEAHEVLEDLWVESEGEEKDFYKGLIQCAVAFVHLDRNNFKGATKLHRTACGYLTHYLPEYAEIDTEHLLEQFETFFVAYVHPGVTVDLESIETPQIITTVE